MAPVEVVVGQRFGAHCPADGVRIEAGALRRQALLPRGRGRARRTLVPRSRRASARADGPSATLRADSDRRGRGQSTRDEPFCTNPSSKVAQRPSRRSSAFAGFGGSWTFILLFLGTLAAWILINVELLPRNRVFDPYPFILLNLALSLLATLQAPVIMMSQNRQARRDRLDAAHDYEVNLRAEIEIRSLHEKLDALQQDRWAELIALQERQLELLEGLRPAPQHAAEATLPTARAASGAWQST